MKRTIEKELHGHTVEVRYDNMTIKGTLILFNSSEPDAENIIAVRREGEKGAYYCNTKRVDWVKDLGKLENEVDVD